LWGNYITDIDGDPNDLDGDNNDVQTTDIGVDEYVPSHPIFWWNNTFYSLNSSADPSMSGYISLEPNGYKFLEGMEVTLTASPWEGYMFDYWSGEADGTNPVTQVTMNADKNIVAHFSVSPGYHSLSRSVTPSEGGFVNIIPFKPTYEVGTEVQVIAINESGYEFDFWNDDTSLKNSSITLTVTSDMSVVANFKKIIDTENGDDGTPGFEFILVIGAVMVMLFVKRRKNIVLI